MKTLSIVRTRQLRLYLDTSVYGGYFDEEFKEDTRKLFEEISARQHIVIVSEVLFREIAKAPANVRELVYNLPNDKIESNKISKEVQVLQQAYIDYGVISSDHASDAEHIATASVAQADILVSWNFKHIVHFERIRGYHIVNLVYGYPMIPIHSPTEVIQHEKK